MKSDKLQDALGMIDPELIEESETPRRARRRLHPRRWIPAIAALLALALTQGAVFGFIYLGKPKLPEPEPTPLPLAPTAVELAQYPVMAQYKKPTVIYHDPPVSGGSQDFGAESPDVSIYYDPAWLADRNEQLQYAGHGVGLTAFFELTVATFLADSKGENRVVSPLNLYMALAMLAEVSAYETQEQILCVLGVSSIKELRTQAYAVWNANYFDDGAVESVISTSIWTDDALRFDIPALRTLASNYFTSTYQGDVALPEYAALYRDWLRAATGTPADREIDSSILTPETMLTVATAIRFGACWDTSLSPSQKIFHGTNGDEPCTMLTGTVFDTYLYETPGVSAVRVPLKHSGALHLFRPSTDKALAGLIEDPSRVMRLVCDPALWENGEFANVTVSFPRFEVSAEADLVEGLQRMGVTDCFDIECSELSGMLADGSDACVEELWSYASVSVNENGIGDVVYEAPERGELGNESGEFLDFVLDRPFLFVITGSDGLPLYVGVIYTVSG